MLNKAALLASDLGMEDLAHDLCWRHIDSYLQAPRPLTIENAQRMLGPALNLARLRLRARQADSALRLLATIHHAISTDINLVIDGQLLPTANLIGNEAELTRLRNIIRAHYLADGIRAHAMTGNWDQAAALAEELGGVSGRLAAGRQAVILAQCLNGNLNTAHRILSETITTERWEEQLTPCLAAMCARPSETCSAARSMISQFLGSHPIPGRIVFWVRLGLAVSMISRNGDPQGARAIATVISEEVIRVADGYAARDLIQNPVSANWIGDRSRKRVEEIMAESGLGSGALPETMREALSDAITATLATQARMISG
jgi:hypothetical protein